MLTAFLPAFVSMLAPLFSLQGADRAAVAAQAPFDSSKYAASAEEQREIAKLIEQLVRIDKPDFGLAATMSGTQFAPVESSRSFGSGLIMVDHRIETSPMVRRLVELGPKALPALLKALDDDAPSKLVMEHHGGFGVMWYGREVPINSANPREKSALAKHGDVLKDSNDRGLGDESDTITQHAITRGDIAFVIVGQIVGRGYEAARYQPTACMVINSPSHDHKIAAAVRAIWSSDDPARMLFDSLTADSSTPREVFDGQPGSTLRLTYYFSSERRDALVRQIDELDVEGTPRLTRGTETLAAAAAGHDPALIAAVTRVIQRTDNASVLAMCATEFAFKTSPEIVVAKISKLLDVAAASVEPTDSFGAEFQLLVATARFAPERARSLFEQWLAHGTTACRRTAIRALTNPSVFPPWGTEVLAPLLDDRSATGGEYGTEYDRHPIRVCDETAYVVARHVKDATFEFEGDPAALDAQIADLRRRIAGEPVAPKKAAIDFAAIPVREPLAAFELDRIVCEVRGISDSTTLYAQNGWGDDTAVIDVATKRVTSVVKIDDWDNDASAIEPVVGEQIFCYHGSSGEIVVRELRTGKELRRIATPFHGGDLNSDDPLHVRGWGDAMATEDGKWIVAATPDGTLHSIEIASGLHRIVSKPVQPDERMHLPDDLKPIRGSSKFLVESFDDDNPLRLWDPSAQSITEINSVPPSFWHCVWGKFGHHFVNEQHELWDLEDRKPIRLPLPRSAEISELVCDATSATAWVATKDGLVYVIDLNTTAVRAKLAASPTPVGLVRLSLSSDRRWFFFSGDLSEYDRKNRAQSKFKTRLAVFEVEELLR